MFDVTPIGFVSSPRQALEDDDWGSVESTVTLVESFGDNALHGLDEFSHVEVVFVFDQVDPARVALSRRPRGNPSWPEIGIFAQRAKDRPNRLGVCTCAVLEVGPRTVRVRGLDAVDGTPILDLKPYMVEFAPRGPVRQPEWSHELMANYF